MTVLSFEGLKYFLEQEGEVFWLNLDRLILPPQGRVFSGLSSLVDGDENQVGFYFSREYKSELAGTRVGALITHSRFVEEIRKEAPELESRCLLVAVSDPGKVMLKLCRQLADQNSTVAHLRRSHESRIHPSAVIPSGVHLGTGVEIGAHVVLSEGVMLGDGVRVDPGCFIGPSVRIGDDSVIFPNVTVYEQVEIGARCRIHSGSVIGADGFGYVTAKDPSSDLRIHHKVYHLGTVRIGDDVEIGACVTIDRATLGVTEVGSGSKLDDHVHIAHNCKVGARVILCGDATLAGGVVIEDDVIVGGKTALDNRIRIGKGALVGGGSGVTGDVGPGEKVAGNPHLPLREYLRLNALLRRMLAQRGNKEKES